jgi:hypothetical protein
MGRWAAGGFESHPDGGRRSQLIADDENDENFHHFAFFIELPMGNYYFCSCFDATFCIAPLPITPRRF